MLTTIPRASPLILGVSGYSGSGKTTLICRLIPHVGRVAVLKHSHHPAHANPDSDTKRFKEAGAAEVILVPDDGQTALDVRTLSERFRGFDAVLLEGWKRGGDWQRLIVNRRGIGSLETAPQAVAEVTDQEPVTGLPSFHPEAIDALILFLDRICR